MSSISLINSCAMTELVQFMDHSSSPANMNFVQFLSRILLPKLFLIILHSMYSSTLGSLVFQLTQSFSNSCPLSMWCFVTILSSSTVHELWNSIWSSLLQKRQRNQRWNYQYPLDYQQSKRVPEKHLFLLYWLCQSLCLCG